MILTTQQRIDRIESYKEDYSLTWDDLAEDMDITAGALQKAFSRGSVKAIHLKHLEEKYNLDKNGHVSTYGINLDDVPIEIIVRYIRDNIEKLEKDTLFKMLIENLMYDAIFKTYPDLYEDVVRNRITKH